MAHSSRGSSSSPALNMSSSQSSASIIIDDRAMQGIKYRRKEVVDGDFVRISETARRRRQIPYKPVAVQNSSHSILINGRIEAVDTAARVVKQPVVVHQSKSSPDVEMFFCARNDSFIDIPSSTNGYGLKPSKEVPEIISSYITRSSPPPTPRIQRLPTPDLEPLKEGPFCDCQHCYVVLKWSNGHSDQFQAQHVRRREVE